MSVLCSPATRPPPPAPQSGAGDPRSVRRAGQSPVSGYEHPPVGAPAHAPKPSPTCICPPLLVLQLSLLIDQEFGGLSLPVAGLGDGLMDPTPERPGENEVEAEANAQLEAGDEAADLGHAEGNWGECAGSSAPFWPASSTRIAARKASASIARVMCRYQPCQLRTS